MPFFGHISAKEHYVLRMVLWLAKTYETHVPVTLAHISEKELISLKYLEQLVRPFLDAGLVKSVRGRNGGYLMVKDPQQVSLHDIIALTYGQLELVECMDEKDKNRCSLEYHCLSKRAWSKVQRALKDTLSRITLEELLH